MILSEGADLMLSDEIKEQIRKNPAFLKELEDPSEELMLYAVSSAWNNLKYFKEPTGNVRMTALKSKGWAIQFIDDPTKEEKLMAVSKDADALQYFSEADCEVQLTAVKNSWRAIRYMEDPCYDARILAIEKNEQAINYISGYSAEELKEYLKLNLNIVKYIYDSIELEELTGVLAGVFAGDPDEKYIRDFMELEVIDMDKIPFIDETGSKAARKRLADYVLGR